MCSNACVRKAPAQEILFPFFLSISSSSPWAPAELGQPSSACEFWTYAIGLHRHGSHPAWPPAHRSGLPRSWADPAIAAVAAVAATMRGGGRGQEGGLWSSSAGSGTAHLRENCSSSHLRSWKLLNFSWPADPSFRRPRDGPPLVRPTHRMSPHHLLYSLASQPCRLRFSCVVCSKSCRPAASHADLCGWYILLKLGWVVVPATTRSSFENGNAQLEKGNQLMLSMVLLSMLLRYGLKGCT
jgi:hypothetical protein